MRACLAHRVGRLEVLEPRRLLDGNVQVLAQGAALAVLGDQLANGVLIEHLGPASPPGATGSEHLFQITPDATTRVNGGAPGAPLMIAAAAGDLVVNLGSGDDLLTFVGAEGHSLRSLRCVTGEGNDRVELVDATFRGDVRCTNSQGNDALLVLHSTIGGVLSVNNRVQGQVVLEDSLVASVSLRNADLSGDALVVRGHARAVFDAAGGSVALHKTEVGGSLDVASQGPLSFDGSSLRAVDMFLKIPAARAGVPAVQRSAIVLNDVLVERDLTVTGGPLTLDMRSVQTGGAAYLKIKLQDILISGHSVHGGDVTVVGSSFSRGFDVSSDLPLNYSFFGHAADRPTESLSLNFTKIELKYQPQSKDAPQGSSVQVKGVEVTGDVSVTGNVRMKVDMEGVRARDMFLKLADAIVAAPLDEASVVLFKDCTFGGNLSVLGGSRVKIDMVRTTTEKQAYFQYKMEDLLVSGYSVHGGTLSVTDGSFAGGVRVISDLPVAVSFQGGGSHGDPIPMESISLHFSKIESRYKPSSPDAIQGSSVSIRGVHVARDISVLGNQGTDVRLDGFTSNGVFIKLEGVDASLFRGGVHVAAGDINGDGRCDIVTAGPTNIRVTALSASDIYLKMADLVGAADDAPESRTVLVSGVDLTGSVDVVSRAPARVTLQGGRAASAYLKLGDIKGEAAAKHKDWINMESFSFTGGVTLDCDGVTDVSVTGVTASQFFLKIDGLKGEVSDPTSRVSMRDLSLSGDAMLLLDGPVSVSLRGLVADTLSVRVTDAASAAGGAVADRADVSVVDGTFLGSVGLFLDVPAAVSLHDCDVADNVLVSSGPGALAPGQPSALAVSARSLRVGGTLSILADHSTSVVLADARIERGTAVKVGSLAPPPAGQVGDPRSLQFAAIDTVFGESLALRSTGGNVQVGLETCDDGKHCSASPAGNPGGNDQVVLEQCDVADLDGDGAALLYVSLGAGDDSLRCLDCDFDSLAVLLGGSGTDALTLDNVTFGRQIVRGWEELLGESANPGVATV